MSVSHDPGFGWTVSVDGLTDALVPMEVRLPGLALSFDLSATPPRLASADLAEDPDTGQVDAEGSRLADALFDAPLDDLLAGRRMLALRPTMLDDLLALLDYEQLRNIGPSPSLASLLAVQPFAALGLDAAADSAARHAVTAVAALARALDSGAEFYDRLEIARRDELDVLISAAAARRPVTTDDEFAAVFATVRAARAVPGVIADFEEMLSAVLQVDVSYSTEYAGPFQPAVLSLSSTWSVDDLRLRLGTDAEEFFAGLRVQGQLPGRSRSSFPLRRGADERLDTLVARVYAWDGELLGEGRVLIRPGALPRGSFDFEVQAPSNHALAAAVGVFFALDRAGRPPALPQELQRLAARRGVRQVHEAIELARHGDLEGARLVWDQAHRMSSVPDPSPSVPAVPALGTLPGDSLRALVESWRAGAARVLREAASLSAEERLTILAPLLRDLGRAAASREVADAYEAYADALAELGDEDAIGYLIDALERRYRLHDANGAIRVVRKIDELNAQGDADA